MTSDSANKQSISNPVIPIVVLVLQIGLISYFSQTILDNLLIGSFHPLKIILVALSSATFITASLFLNKNSKIFKVLIIFSIISGALAAFRGLTDITIAVIAPTFISGVFLLFKNDTKYLVLQFALMLLATATSAYHATSDEFDAKNVVASTLNDPESAKFRNIRSTKWSVGNFVCGEINAKNKMGGYSGYEGFYYINKKVVFYSGLNKEWIHTDSSNHTRSCLITIFKSTENEMPSWLK